MCRATGGILLLVIPIIVIEERSRAFLGGSLIWRHGVGCPSGESAPCKLYKNATEPGPGILVVVVVNHLRNSEGDVWRPPQFEKEAEIEALILRRL